MSEVEKIVAMFVLTFSVKGGFKPSDVAFGLIVLHAACIPAYG